jgi:regulator of replication initiation timing
MMLHAQAPEDWDAIHFESDSSELVDGLASLRRLARLLENRALTVQLTGHADALEDKKYGQRLSLARAEAVKAFLIRYGATPGQIMTLAAGAASPLDGNETREGRFKNRRVEISVRDSQGRVIREGGVSDGTDALAGRISDMSKSQQDGIDQTLKRLDKLDDLLAGLKMVSDENNRLRAELDDVRNQLNSIPKPLTQMQTAEAVRNALGASAQENNSAWWSGGFSGRAFLVGKQAEDKRYGLFSYLLIPRQPGSAETGLKKKYVAVLDSFQAGIDTVKALQNQPSPPALNKINITYLPLQFWPQKPDTESLLAANNSAFAQTLLKLLETKHQNVGAQDGPFLVSYREPLAGLTRIDEHLFIDMSHVPADAASLYIRAFRTQAGHEQYWKQDHNQWVLTCYSFIENAGEEFAQVASQYKDKSFLTTIFGWFK